MRAIEKSDDRASLELTLAELDAVRNALNEVRLLLDSDFETRIGVSKDDARRLLHELQDLIRQMSVDPASKPTTLRKQG